MQVTLLVRAPKKPEKRVLVESDVVIGRGKDCNLQVLSNDVSRQHCRLVVGDSEVAICDLGSGNGTLINGQKTVPNENTPLISGDIVRIGPLVIRVEFETASVPEAETPLTSPPEEQVLEPADEGALLADEEPLAEVFTAVEPAVVVSADPASEVATEVQQPVEKNEKKKSLFGMFGRKKSKTEPATEPQPAEPEVSAESEDAEPEPLLVAADADLDQETVVVNQGNSLSSDEPDLELLAEDEDDFTDEEDYLDDDMAEEEEAIDPGFADFLNNVDPPPK